MKLLILLLSFFLFSSKVMASAYLTDIKIDDVELSPKYDKYNNTYTGTINEDTTIVDIQYVKESESSEVEIIGNDNLVNEINYISINVSDNKEKQKYTIILNKDIKSTTTFNIIEESTQEENDYILIILVLSNIIITMLTYKLLFKRKTHKK